MPPFPPPELGDLFFPDPLDPCMPSPTHTPTPPNLVVGNPTASLAVCHAAAESIPASGDVLLNYSETATLDTAEVSFVPSTATNLWAARAPTLKSSPAHAGADPSRPVPPVATNTHLDPWSHFSPWRSAPQPMYYGPATWSSYPVKDPGNIIGRSSFVEPFSGNADRYIVNERGDLIAADRNSLQSDYLPDLDLDEVSDKWNVSTGSRYTPKYSTYSRPQFCLGSDPKLVPSSSTPKTNEHGAGVLAHGRPWGRLDLDQLNDSQPTPQTERHKDERSSSPSADPESTSPAGMNESPFHSQSVNGPATPSTRPRNHNRRRRRGAAANAFSVSSAGKWHDQSPTDSVDRSDTQGPLMTVREFNRQISAYARKRDLKGALFVLAELDASPSMHRNLFTYNAIINALVMCSEFDQANQLWSEMLSSGIQPNLVTYNTMLKSCFSGTSKDVTHAFALVEEMEKNHISADRVTLNSLINACVAAGRVHDAWKVYETMRERNIEPDDFTFTTLAKAGAANNDTEMLDALLLHQLNRHSLIQQKLSLARTIAPRSPDYGRQRSKVTGSSSGSQPKSVNCGGDQISPVAYNAIADAYIRCGQPLRALELLNRLDNAPSLTPGESARTDFISATPDVQTYNVKLKALREAQRPCHEAFRVVEDMNAAGLESDHITLLTLADLCCRRGEMNLAEGVLRAATNADLDQFHRGDGEWRSLRDSRVSGKDSGSLHATSGKYYNRSFRRSLIQPSNSKANSSLFNALIRGYSSLEPPNIEAAMALYAEMRKFVDVYGFLFYGPDSVTYTMLVDSFARVGDAEGAEKIISEMESSGPESVSVVAYNALLKANRANGSVKAFEILERIKSRRLNPDVVTYNTICDILSNEENGVQLAEQLVKEMPKYNVKPDLLTFNTLLKGAARSKGYSSDPGAVLTSAFHWLRELRRYGLRPDEFTYQSMVSACAAAGDASRALEFFRCIENERAKHISSGDATRSLSTGNLSGLSKVAHREESCSPRHSPSRVPRTGLSRASTSVNDQLMNLGQQELLRNASSVGDNPDIEQAQPGKSSLSSCSSDDLSPLAHPAAYVALMRAFLTSGRDDGVAYVFKLRDEMLERGISLGRAGHTAVADAYAELGDVQNVEVTLSEMLAKEHDLSDKVLSPVHYSIRMKALCNANRVDDAIALIPEVKNPDAAIFNTLIFACVRLGDRDRMFVILRAMERAGVEPDAITARALGGLMRSLASALRTFNARFRNGIAKFVTNLEDSAVSSVDNV